jgi:peptide/nickel transport system substrate-binding protein
MTNRIHSSVLAVLASAFLATPAIAQDGGQELTIGLTSEPTSIDPHFHNLGPNNQTREHIFESLIKQDASQALKPGLATEWKAVDDTTWRFTLRENVAFHDGSPFTARDVVYTVCRIPTVQDSPSSFTVYTKAIADMQIEDDHTLIIKTDTPYPLLPTELSTWGILSASANGVDGEITFDRAGCEGIGTPPQSGDFNSPEVAVGTGPYRFEEYIRGNRIVLTRYEDYWGEASEWERVVMRPITSDGPRVAALLAGDVDMIESPPIQDIERLRSEGFEVVEGLSNRVIYLHMDQDGKTVDVEGTDGKNPFLDPLVREAVSKAIYRKAIVERIMGGVARPAGELLPAPMFGTSDRAPDPYDPEAARKLLAEAGYEDGFTVTLGTPNDRYVNDEEVAQAVAQMLTQIGIETRIDASTASQFFSRRNNFEFPIYLAGWGAGTGEISSPLAALVATYNPEKGRGGTNAGRYSNPNMDAALDKALTTIDDAERERFLQEAQDLVLDDYGIIPLHFEVTTWAFREDLGYEPRADQYTLAHEVTSDQ